MLIKQLGEEHTVILSSHILSEVQAICDQVLIISHGRLMAFDTPAGLEKSLGAGQISLAAASGEEKVKRIMAGINSVYRLRAEETGENFTRFSVKTDSKDICRPPKEMFLPLARFLPA